MLNTYQINYFIKKTFCIILQGKRQKYVHSIYTLEYMFSFKDCMPCTPTALYRTWNLLFQEKAGKTQYFKRSSR